MGTSVIVDDVVVAYMLVQCGLQRKPLFAVATLVWERISTSGLGMVLLDVHAQSVALESVEVTLVRTHILATVVAVTLLVDRSHHRNARSHFHMVFHNN
jgi:hypothetical protein